MNYQQNFINKFDEVIPDKDFDNLNKKKKAKVAIRFIKPNTERYIFRLFQLGIIEDWSVKEGQDLIKETYQVKANNLDDDELVEKLKITWENMRLQILKELLTRKLQTIKIITQNKTIIS